MRNGCKVRLERGPKGLYFELVEADRRLKHPRSVVFQTDWDFPGLAGHFGYVPCECGATDGTVNCVHKTATQMISEAYDFLCRHEGEVIDDPGYLGG
jgi:hypothetical protein